MITVLEVELGEGREQGDAMMSLLYFLGQHSTHLHR